MKICFISPKAYPLFNARIKSTFGGAEVQLYQLSKELTKKADVCVHFMVADYGQNLLEIHNGVNVWRSIDFRKNFLRRMLSFFLTMRKINADYYVSRTLTPQSWLIGLYCRLTGKKYIYMVAHDREVDGTHELYGNFFKRCFVKANFVLANKIYVQNLYQRDILNKYNPCFLNSSFKIGKKVREKKGGYILWVGRSEEWKRPEIFLKLAKENPKQNFLMVCPPSTNSPLLSKKIKSAASKIKNLKYQKFVPFYKIDSYFEDAKIFVNTSKKEGFPNTFIQAAKNSTPIVSLSVNPNNFIDKYKCGFYCDDDLEKMNSYIRKLNMSRKLYKIMSMNAYKYAKNNHDIAVNCRLFFESLSTI